MLCPTTRFHSPKFDIKYKTLISNTVEPRLTPSRPCFSTDTCLIRTPCYYGQFSLSPWRALKFFLTWSTRLIRKPVNADNGHLFLAQSTDSDKESTVLINADTSLSTVCGKRPFLFRVKKNTFSWQHVDVPSATVHLIACCADYFYQMSYAENGFYDWVIFECFRGFCPRNGGFVKIRGV